MNPQNKQNNLTMAIESAIGGGSLSIWDGDCEVDFWVGTGDVSKAEDLLEGISDLLLRNCLSKERFGLIAFSTDPGSPTGLKIGSAIAQGLSKSFGCELLGISMWDALAVINKEVKFGTVFLPVGRDKICRRDLEDGKFSLKYEILDAAFVFNNPDSELIRMSNSEKNFAYYIGKSIALFI